ncbi:CoA transferase subunit A [Desulfobacula toluolica]|uniref:AtoD: acyl CoA:acetate/3-ketoacid CoA transferase, alpha subunit n=1 Tax=Desulfobacula toluolica (strain DSM 7467 / Tol2) TaxID=651182 RepID=K0NMI6_DESTT|nr:CoA-transferase [Desulfobacula toluolica]CCK79917.1 AtoD: acyl CoA:acetate/3-ketoacid CoA transferase, alpha subunit [Desulfobacula toluolica Tol2]
MELLESGVGQLFTDPDPDNARAFFRTKSRKMTNKLMTVKDAVEKFTHDEDYLAIGGFGANRIPTAICHELLRQGRKKMGFAGHTATHDFQILSAGKVFNRLDASYVVGLEARGLSPNARKYLQSGEVEVTDWSNYGLAARFKAAAMGVPFLPIRTSLGTETYKYSAAKTIECPFTEVPYMAVPALYPDVAAIHVHAADVYGNCQLKGITISDLDVARAAKRLIITTEKIISNDDIRREPIRTIIPYYLVDAVCEVPYGSYPGNMAYEYFSDEEHIQEWMRLEKDPEAFKEFLDKNIYQCETHFDYLQKNGGMEKMRKLRQKELLVSENKG